LENFQTKRTRKSVDYIELLDALVESYQADFDRAPSTFQLLWREALRYIDKWMAETPINSESSYFE